MFTLWNHKVENRKARKTLAQRRRQAENRRVRQRLLGCELLEDRRMLAVVPGDILVADSGVPGVIQVDPTTGVQSTLSSGGNFVTPIGVAVDDITGDVFIADANAAVGSLGAVIRVDPNTGAQSVVSSGGNFVDPHFIAIEADGSLVVADANAAGGPGAVIRVNRMTGAQTVVSSGGNFVDPAGIEVAPDGTIYVSDRNTGGSPPFNNTGNSGGALIAVNPSTGAQTIINNNWGATGFFDPSGVVIEASGIVLVADLNSFDGGSDGQGGGVGAVFRVDPTLPPAANRTIVNGGSGSPPLDFESPSDVALEPNGNILMIDSNGPTAGDEKLFRIDPITGAVTILVQGGLFDNPNGLDVMQSLDFGDAPEPTYPTLAASNGARHVLGSGLVLGATVDAEADGQPDATATGDDVAGMPDDEDGVFFTSVLIPGSLANVTVTASATSLLDAWIDFDNDGSWAHPGEQIFTSQALVAGANMLTFAVPGGATLGARTFARFRLSTAGGLSPTGFALDGEVEDYALGSIRGQKFEDLNGDGARDPNEPGLNGFVIDLYDANDTSLVASATTMDMEVDGLPGIDPVTERGLFWLPGVPEGDYVLREVQEPGWAQSYPGGIGPGDPLALTPLPTAWWTGDGDASDVIAGRDGTLRDNATTTAGGLIDGAFLLDGDGDFVEIPDDPALDFGTGDFTISLWANFQSTAGEQILIEKWIQSSTFSGEGWTFTKLSSNRLGLHAGATVSERLDTPPLMLLPSTWYHFVATRHDDVAAIYVNGSLVASQSYAINDLDSSSSIKFGHRGIPGDTPGSIDTPGYYFNGSIDDVQLYRSHALSLEEIAGLYDAGLAGKTRQGFHFASVSTGEVVVGQDFGNILLGSIEGQKFEDLNANGQRDPGEPGLAGWTIQLDRDADGSIDAVTTTDATGNYAFTSLYPGNYVVSEAGLAGSQPTVIPIDPRMSFLRANSDSPQDALKINLVALGIHPGDSIQLTRLGDHDANGGEGDTTNSMIGVFSSNDTLLGSSVLHRVPGALDAGSDVVTNNTLIGNIPTDITEDFSIDDLLVDVPVGATYLFIGIDDSLYGDNFDPDGDSAIRIRRIDDWRQSAPASATYTVALQSGDVVLDRDFGNFVPGSIHGFKFEDLDGNGVYDELIDRPASGVTFTLTGADGLGNVIDQSMSTDERGEFWFSRLSPSVSGAGPGTGYTVIETVPAGYVATTPTSFTSDLLSRQVLVAYNGQAILPPPTYAEEQKLLSSDAAANDRFGYSVASDGNIAVVGAYGHNGEQGAAYVYEFQAGSWTEVGKLTASDGVPGDQFGRKLSVSGDTVVIGARGDDDNGSDSGSAYVFVKPNAGWSNANESAKLTASDGAADDRFGWSVSVSGDTIVIGTPFDDDGGSASGSAYVYVRPGTGWATTSSFAAKLTASDGEINDTFGQSVSVSGDTVLIGTPGDDDNGSGSGSAYVYLQPSTGWATTSSFDAKLIASDGAADDHLGWSVSISGETVAIGAWGDDDFGSSSGSAYVFVRPSTGWATTSNFTAKLTANDAAAGDNFGHSVSVGGDRVVIGAYNNDDHGSNSGSAYVFTKPVAGWTNANEDAKLTASDGAATDYFGSAVSVSGNTVMIGAYHDDDDGADSGSAYVFSPVPDPRVEVRVGTPLMFGNAQMDFGDALDAPGTPATGNPYPTLLEHDGARHVLGSELFLGTAVDAESDGQPDATATGDDLADTADEDGVTFTSSFIPGSFATVTVNASMAGKLDAWVDFDNDGDWMDSGERIFDSRSLVAGDNFLSYAVPAGAKLGAHTFARFRLSSTGGLSPTGLAVDGEVEDYAVNICNTVVTNINDRGAGSLREAILCSNGATGMQTISFAIAGAGVHTIAPASALPEITDVLIIDGSTQSGFAVGAPVIELDGTGAGVGVAGLKITVGGSTVRGLAINRFAGSGIELRTGGGNVIEGNFLGTDVGGTLDRGNARDGVLIVNSASNTIGGTTSGAGNVLSGNSRYGMYLVGAGATGNVVQGNFIGTNAAGTGAVGNNLSGVVVYQAPSNTIGGTVAGAGNVISGNMQRGVYLAGAGSTGNLVQSNFIGTDATGAVDLGNTRSGVYVTNTGGNTIGGTTAAARNVISGNDEFGVQLLNSSMPGNLVQGNYIGTNAAGTGPVGNSRSGVILYKAPSNTIGGTVPEARNVISGNAQYGVYLARAGSTGNLVQGNYIGTNAAGTEAVGNRLSGVLVYKAPSNTIGGTVAGAGNVIAGNTRYGLYLVRAETTGNLVQGNYIGTNAAGTAPVGNGLSGVLVYKAPSNAIGGSSAGAGNVISGNEQYGVYLAGAVSTGNLVQGNYVGTGANGTSVVGNATGGVWVANASSNTIGGTASGVGNTIAFNGRNGVRVTGQATGNPILRNSFFTNTGLAIDLNGDGVTANDPGDADTGPNNRQNFPVFTSVVSSGPNLNITYSVPSVSPNSTFPLRVEFFIADAANQEGQTFLGADSYTTPGAKVAAIPAGSAVFGTKIVATATDNNGTGSTSEFSANATVAGALVAAGGAAPITAFEPAALTLAQLAPIVDIAISRLSAQGLTVAQVRQLSSITFAIADLPGATLGLATPRTVTLDVNAAGYGWFVDRTPHDDAEFSPGSRLSTPDARLQMDLLTAVMHELSHELGREDLHDHGTEDDLMYEALAVGVRRTALDSL